MFLLFAVESGSKLESTLELNVTVSALASFPISVFPVTLKPSFTTTFPVPFACKVKLESAAKLVNEFAYNPPVETSIPVASDTVYLPVSVAVSLIFTVPVPLDAGILTFVPLTRKALLGILENCSASILIPTKAEFG